jgi:hypothetical protein
MKCVLYRICGQASFKNARAIFFFEVGPGGQHILVGFINIFKGLSNPNLTPQKFVGDI